MHRTLPALSFVALVATVQAASLKSPEHLAAEVRALAAEKIEVPRLTGSPLRPPSSQRSVLKPLFRIAPSSLPQGSQRGTQNQPDGL